jgi:hypothetical protein
MKIENDAIKLMLKREKDETSRIPGNASGSRLSGDRISQRLELVRSVSSDRLKAGTRMCGIAM